MEQSLLGQLLLEFNLLTEAQLRTCVEEQQNSLVNRALGEILVEHNFIDERTLSSILSVQKRKVGIDKAQQRMSVPQLNERLANAGIREYLAVARELGASDLILSSGYSPTVRLHGSLVELPTPPLDLQACKDLVFFLLGQEQLDHYLKNKDLSLCLEFQELGRFRINVFRHLGGIAAVFGLISPRPWAFEDLHLPDQVRRFVDFSHGLVLITGPAGSGKTTTLAALVEMINQSRGSHILTIERPIEIVHKNAKSLISQVEVGKHSPSFHDALLAGLRQDPDVIVVGDLRDPEVTATAMTAAETGHLVFATMPNKDVCSTLLRVVDQFPPSKQTLIRAMLASTLRAVLCQQLVPHLDGKGRSVACEIMFVNSAISNIIREDRIWQIPMVMQTNRSSGMRILDDSLQFMVRDKKISMEEALSRASEHELIVSER